MVQNHVLHVFHIKARIAAVGYVACAKTDVANNDVILTYIYVGAGDTYTAAGCCLSGNSHVRVLKLKFRVEIDSTAHLEEHGAWCIIAGA